MAVPAVRDAWLPSPIRGHVSDLSYWPAKRHDDRLRPCLATVYNQLHSILSNCNTKPTIIPTLSPTSRGKGYYSDGKQGATLCPVDRCLLGRVIVARSLLSTLRANTRLSFVRKFVHETYAG